MSTLYIHLCLLAAMLLTSGCGAGLTNVLRAVHQQRTPPRVEAVVPAAPAAPFHAELDDATATLLAQEGVQCGVPIFPPYSPPPLEDFPVCARLMLTIEAGDLAATQALLDDECAVDVLVFGNTPLMLAARSGQLDIVEHLLQQGAEVNYQKRAGAEVGTAEVGQTALWYAVAKGHSAIVAHLLAQGADPNLHPLGGFPLLILASVANEAPEIARQLVEAGVDVHERAPTGATAMTQGNGPSAEMFAYLTSIGVATDGMAPALAESLRWEVAQRPAPGAAPDEQLAYLVQVAANTRSARSREQAVLALGDFGAGAASATPTLVAIIAGEPLTAYDWSGAFAAETLLAIGASEELTASLPTLLHLLATDHRQQVRIKLLHLVTQVAPFDEAVLASLVGQLHAGETQGDRAQAAAALAVLAHARIDAAPTGWDAVRGHILPALTRAFRQEYDPIVRGEILEALQNIACERRNGG